MLAMEHAGGRNPAQTIGDTRLQVLPATSTTVCLFSISTGNGGDGTTLELWCWSHGRCTVRLHWECHLRVSEEAAGEEAGLY
jgi:hypothetical protein